MIRATKSDGKFNDIYLVLKDFLWIQGPTKNDTVCVHFTKQRSGTL